MVLPEWKDLSPLIRRNPRAMYELLRSEINSESKPKEKLLFSVKPTVTDGSNPIEKVTVTLTNSDESYSGTTGKAGGCTISNVPQGEYSLKATKNGLDDYTSTVSIDKNNQSLNVVMVELEEDS